MTMTIPSRNCQRDALLQEAIALTTRLQIAPDSQKTRLSDRLRNLSEHLKQYAHPIQTQDGEIEAIPLQVRRSFVEAIALLPLFHQLSQPKHIQGTLPWDTLRQLRPDSVPLGLPQATDKLAAMFALPEVETAALQRQLQRVKQRCDRHRQLMQALLTNVDPEKLFQQLFVGLDVPASSLRYMATDWQIIFALTEEAEVVLNEVTTFQFSQFDNFPSFGPLDPAEMDPKLLADLVTATGFEPEEILRSLQQVVGLIPAAKADLFLVHDVCGHLWQLLLTTFDADYRCLAQVDLPLKPGLAAYGEAGPLALREVFLGDRNFETGPLTIRLDEERARYFFRGEMQQRLGHLLTHLVAEMLADVQEFRWSRALAKGASVLASSSVLLDWPAKLDLTLRDVHFFLPSILEPLLSLSVSPHQETFLEEALLLEWGQFSAETRLSLKGAIAQLQQCFWAEYQALYPSCFNDVVANLLHLQNVLNQLYTSAPGQQPSFQDVLLLFVAAFCTGDCYSNFWEVDDAIAAHFLSCWQHWQAAITTTPKQTGA